MTSRDHQAAAEQLRRAAERAPSLEDAAQYQAAALRHARLAVEAARIEVGQS